MTQAEPETMPDSPADTAERIKAALRGATSRADLLARCDEHREAVAQLAETEEGRPLAIHCRNLKTYMLRRLT